MIVFLTEIMLAKVRTGLPLVYSLATEILGGFAPAISTYLTHATGNRAVSGAMAVVRHGVGTAGDLVRPALRGAGVAPTAKCFDFCAELR